MSWGRVGSVGRFDRLWHTDGRPFVRGAHQRHGAARAGHGQVLLECWGIVGDMLGTLVMEEKHSFQSILRRRMPTRCQEQNRRKHEHAARCT